MRTIILRIAYDGSHYAGWQQQQNALGIQSVICAALQRMTREEQRLVAASRTDAGVHALGQIAVFRTATAIAPSAFVAGLRGYLPPEIVVTDAVEGPGDFHPRRDATAKTYRYLLHCGAPFHPLLRERVWMLHHSLHTDAMTQAAAVLCGEHDFRAFAASNDHNRSKVCVLSRFHIACVPAAQYFPSLQPITGTVIGCEITGNRFLKQMIRNMVGTLMEVGEGRRAPDTMTGILASQDRRRAGRCAPGCGLYLTAIDYPCPLFERSVATVRPDVSGEVPGPLWSVERPVEKRGSSE
ncbi:MAG: tRNA pseudouridine(38-40) synthase TruA [Deltaproteobacteria bacterium]|nr:tRNA pseudouridine(38-40) synthase TruA [Deltaproteobacteria bacterium]